MFCGTSLFGCFWTFNRLCSNRTYPPFPYEVDNLELVFIGMALLGCDVVTTDQKEVLPILTRNIERNTPSLAQMNPSGTFENYKLQSFLYH